MFDKLKRRVLGPLDPQAVKVVEETYLWLLRDLPHEVRWTQNGQARLCALRDYIASATGRTAQDVQDSAEEKVLLERLAAVRACEKAP